MQHLPVEGSFLQHFIGLSQSTTVTGTSVTIIKFWSEEVEATLEMRAHDVTVFVDFLRIPNHRDVESEVKMKLINRSKGRVNAYLVVLLLLLYLALNWTCSIL